MVERRPYEIAAHRQEVKPYNICTTVI